MDSNSSTKRVAAVILLVLFAGLVLACSSERDDPLLSPEELFTPTPLPSDTPVPTAAANETKPTDIFGFEYNGKVTLAQWDDPAVQMENFIVGYIIVQGMVYETELVEVAESEYAAALQSGDVDVVLEVGRTEPVSTVRAAVGVGRSDRRRLPLRRVLRCQDRRAGSVEGDRPAGVRPLDQSRGRRGSSVRSRIPNKGRSCRRVGERGGHDVSKAARRRLTSWVSPETAANVKAAMEEGKTSLSYKCLQVPGELVKYCK